MVKNLCVTTGYRDINNSPHLTPCVIWMEFFLDKLETADYIIINVNVYIYIGFLFLIKNGGLGHMEGNIS